MTVIDVERYCGIEKYSTAGNRVIGSIKTKPEDFIVEEIDTEGNKCEIESEEFNDFGDKSHKFVEFLMVKKNFDTFEAIRRISMKLNLYRPNYINFAGLKDKRALTCQRMSMFAKNAEALKKIKIKNIQIRNIKYSKKPIQLGELYGNYFKIIIRNISESELNIRKSFEEKFKEINSGNGILNYFGLQRFGEVRPISHLCGRKLLHNDIEGCIKVYLCQTFEGENARDIEFRKHLEQNWDLKQSLHEIPRGLYYERGLIGFLSKKSNEGDYKKAFNMVFPLSLRSLFVNAFQSYIFNKYLSKMTEVLLDKDSFEANDQVLILDENGLPTKIIQEVNESNKFHLKKLKNQNRACLAAPIIGYETRIIDDALKAILDDEEVTKDDFKLKDFKGLSSKGLYRPVFFQPENLNLLNIKTDKMFKQKNELELSFKLKKGTYATVLLREFIKNK